MLGSPPGQNGVGWPISLDHLATPRSTPVQDAIAYLGMDVLSKLIWRVIFELDLA